MQRNPNQCFVFGIKELDNIYSKALTPGTTILIAGNPGAGKTTLAATICYHNAIRGCPCIYVSFNEDKNKFIKRMKTFGMDFEKLEKNKLFKYLRLPLLSSRDIIDDLINAISTEIIEFQAKIVVLDSFTPIGHAVEKTINARGLIQNYVYNIASLIQGLVVIIAEIPLGETTIKVGDVEFVADVVLILKHNIENKLLNRVIELRKLRDARISVAEIPFILVEGKGIRLFYPPIQEEPPSAKLDVELKHPCKQLAEAIEPVYPGNSMLVVYPPDARSIIYTYMPIITMLTINKLKTLIVTYRYSVKEIEKFAKQLLNKYGINSDDIMNNIIVKAINPASLSLEEILGKELELVDEYKPDAMIFHGVEVVNSMHGNNSKYYMFLRNQLLYHKSKGILTIRYMTLVDKKKYYKNAELSEIIMRLYYKKTKEEKLEPYLYVWRAGKEPTILTPKQLSECLSECIKALKGE
ncbi:AAA family ATPase [Desulfurococcaceae archaeon MEX13E-LK6-19]|nr:AAA family ATPase [Desulfurococcaceae archaeon MEX13E-LK6-19]